MKKTVKKKTPKRKKTHVLIVGAGKGGSLLIDLLHKSTTVKIVGVVDKKPDAPGMKLAMRLNIPSATHFKEFLKKKTVDEIINVTGSTRVQRELSQCKLPHVEVIGGRSAKLIWELVEERRHIEKTFQKSEEKFRLAFENAKDAIFWAHTKTGIIVNCNKAAEALVEKKRDEIIGHHQAELHPPKQSANPFKKHVSGKFSSDTEAEVITKSGKIIPVIITPSITFVGDEPIIQGIFHDITNRKVAEKALRKSEEKYRDLYDNAPDMYHTLDKNGIIIDCNETEARMLGYEKHDLIGKPITDFFTKESQELFRNDFPRLNMEKRLLNLEREYVRKDGSTFPAMLNVFSEYDKDGNFLKAKTISRDTTILKFAEKALRDSEQKYRDLVDNALIGIFQTTIDGDILYVNEALSTMMEYESPEVMMLNNVLTTYKDRRDRQVLLSKLYEEHKVTSFECDLITKKGNTKNVLISAALSNNIISGMLMDITEHKRAEERISFLAQLLNTSPLSVIATDEHGKIIYVNPATSKLFGYEDTELLGKDPVMLNARPDEKQIQKDILETVRRNEVWTGEMVNKKKNGTLFYTRDTIYKLTNEKGDFSAFVSFAEDITDRKKLEEQLLQAKKMEAVGQLAGGIAHDFNNILTAIIGYGNLIKTEILPNDPLSIYIQRILTSAQRAANLTRSLLTFSRTQIIHARHCNLNDIINNISELLPRLIGESIDLSIMLAREDLTIVADSSQIELVLINLATNALDAMPDGGKLIIRTERITAEDSLPLSYGSGKHGSYALLSIEDNGQGIDEKTRERLFEPFFTTKEVGKGTGLGLSMTYGIIKQHDSHIDVYSEPGKGTTFKIYFPLIQPQVEKEGISESFVAKTGHETILVAEDDIQVRDLIKHLLEMSGYNVIVTKDGKDTIDIFMKYEDMIHLLLLDVIMPKKNGKEVYDEIKKRNPRIKVVFISGYSSDIIHKKGILDEGLDFLSKPILQETLLTKVREVLDR